MQSQFALSICARNSQSPKVEPRMKRVVEITSQEREPACRKALMRCRRTAWASGFRSCCSQRPWRRLNMAWDLPGTSCQDLSSDDYDALAHCLLLHNACRCPSCSSSILRTANGALQIPWDTSLRCCADAGRSTYARTHVCTLNC